MVIDHLVLVFVPVVVVFGGDPGGVFMADSVARFGGYPECCCGSVVYPAELFGDPGDHDLVTSPCFSTSVERFAGKGDFHIWVTVGPVPVQSR